MPDPVDTAPATKPVKPRAEFRHPVLEMMGVRRLRIPSRNWLIFWTVTGTLVGGYYWDRYERKKVRDYWVNRVKYLADEEIKPTDVARKIKVYMAPPPNDFIDATKDEFRNFIKPVLTAAAVDHEIIMEERQGYIRTRVSEEIRELRRQMLAGDQSSTDVSSSVWNQDSTGGTMIIGRGAYKEYMSGLQEGWLGPLERPAEVQAIVDEEKQVERERLKQRHEEKAKATDGEDQFDYDDQTEYERDRKATLHNKYPVVPPYLPLSEVNEQPLPAEYAKHAPEPISVYPLPNLLGILMTPWRIYRWLNQRKQAELMGKQTAGLVFARTRPFEIGVDENLAISDEDDWPSKFKQQGLDNNSEWMREFLVDERIAQSVNIYTDAERLPEDSVTDNS